jgi:glyoxylase-like metal-dependent hydrolase (beta-lactamase superfamily II)
MSKSNPLVQHFYDDSTGTLSYVVSDRATACAAVIDPVLGFDIVSGRTDASQIEVISAYLEEHDLALDWILETHAHADHLTAAQLLKARQGGQIAIGHGICKVQEYFGRLFNLKEPFRSDGSQFDRLFDSGDRFHIGKLECRVLSTPGHTSDSVSYVIGDAAFVGDTLFAPDYGTARCDFPGGDASLLFDSIQRLLSLPAGTDLYLCHDYRPNNRELQFRTTVDAQRDTNIHIGGGCGKEEFVAMRQARDKTLSLPALLLPALQVNVRAGHCPEAEDNSVSYLKIPLDQL